MLWRWYGVGVAIFVVILIVLGRIGSIVVD